MRSELTKSQIAVFGRFRKAIEGFLNANSKPVKGSNNRQMDAEAFHTVAKIAFWPSQLRPVMNNVTSLRSIGRTKQNWVQRDEEGNLLANEDGSPKFACKQNHCLMFTAKAFRDWRAEQTGIQAPETVYTLPWEELETKIRATLSAKLPWKDGKRLFTPKAAGILVRKGNAPAEGEKRVQWQRMLFLVSGEYDGKTCVVSNAAVFRPKCPLELGEALGIPREDIPVFETEESKTESESYAKAASTQAALLDNYDHFFDF